MVNLDTFLEAHAPFDGLAPDRLRAIVARSVVRDQNAGDVLLVEDGAPATELWVIVSGSVELVHDGEVVQVLEPGECFGHPSLLTGMGPAFTVRARERSSCVLLSPDDARELLGTAAGASYVAQTMRTRLTRAGHTVHGLQDVGTTPVSAIMRPATFAAAGESVADAARRLGSDGVTALLVELDGGVLGIVTDADIRAKVVVAGISTDAPIGAIATSPVTSVPVGQLAIEATVDMLAGGISHLVVTDARGVCGVLAAADLLGLDARSPIGLRHTILGASDERVLVRAVSHLPSLFLALSRAGVPSRDLGRVLSLAHDAVVSKLIDFSIWRRGAAPVAWSWLDLGSAARREFTLASDQDNALAYGQPREGAEADVDGYFEALGADVNGGLERCGIGLDNNNVLARARLWRMSKQDWMRTFDECLTQPDESHLIRATVAFDFRSAGGGLAIAAELAGRIRAARDHPQFMRLLARSAAGFPVALGFRGQIATDRDGEHAGRFDVKRGGIIPVVNLVRYHALAAGVTISPTLDRIEAVGAAGGLRPDEAEALREAFEVITKVRFEHHARLIGVGESADNWIDPGELAPIGRSDLREALQTIRRAQKRLPA
jgi:CBS domain-containing protein